MTGRYLWSLPRSSGSWDEVVFPIRFWDAGARASGWFAAFQFNFAGNDDSGSIGVLSQPEEVLETWFSVTGAGSKVVDTDRCHADGQSVHCNGRFPVASRAWHFLKVARQGPGSRIWQATAHDPYRQQVALLGAWEVSHDRGLATEGSGYVQRRQHCASCNQLPRVQVDFGGPQNWASPHTYGVAHTPHHTADHGCTREQENYRAETWDDNVRLSLGWAGATCGGTRTLPGDRTTGRSSVHVAVNVTVDNRKDR